jgi:hypothetical protein
MTIFFFKKREKKEMIFLFAILSFSRNFMRYQRKRTVAANGKTGVVNCYALNVRSGPSTSYSKVGMLYIGDIVYVYEVEDGWAKIDFNGAQRYASAKYLDISEDPSPPTPGWPPANPTRMGNRALNSNINKAGSAFMACCWLGKKNSVNHILDAYNLAVNSGAMKSDCYIISWDRMKCVTGAKSCRTGSKDENIKNGEKEILLFFNGHHAVGDGNGIIEYDPMAQGFVKYEDHNSKRIFSY